MSWGSFKLDPLNGGDAKEGAFPVMTLPTIQQLDFAGEWLIRAGFVLIVPLITVFGATVLVAIIIGIVRAVTNNTPNSREDYD